MVEYYFNFTDIDFTPSSPYRVVSSLLKNNAMYYLSTSGDIYRLYLPTNEVSIIGNIETKLDELETLHNRVGINDTININTENLMFSITSSNNISYVYSVNLETFDVTLIETHAISTSTSYITAVPSRNVIKQTENGIEYFYYYENSNNVVYSVFKDSTKILSNIQTSLLELNDAFPLITNSSYEQFMFGFARAGGLTNSYSDNYGFTFSIPTTLNTIPNNFATYGQPFELGDYYWCMSRKKLNDKYPIYRIDKSTLVASIYGYLDSVPISVVGVGYIGDKVMLFSPRFDYMTVSKSTFTINLYQNSAEANRVDKTNYLTSVGSLNGVMREGSSITDLSITFEMDTLPQFNYVHIPAFNRYYYVTDISTIKYRLWEMDLEVDVLMSYKDAILSCYAFVDRNEFSTNEFLPDKKRVIEEGVDVQVLEGNRNLFNTNINSGGWMYVLNGYNIRTAYVEPPEEE